MSELTHGSQFREWTSEKRNKLMEDLISIIQIHAYRKFGCFVINQTFATLPKDQREDWGMTAYALAGRTVASYVQHWALKEPAGSIPPIEYVFEDGDKGEGKLRELMKRDVLSVSFRPKKDTPTTRGFTPLQAADILAYDMLRIVRHRTAKRGSFLALDQIPGDLGGFDEKTLEKLKDRMDFFVEHPDLRARTEWL